MMEDLQLPDYTYEEMNHEVYSVKKGNLLEEMIEKHRTLKFLFNKGVKQYFQQMAKEKKLKLHQMGIKSIALEKITRKNRGLEERMIELAMKIENYEAHA